MRCCAAGLKFRVRCPNVGIADSLIWNRDYFSSGRSTISEGESSGTFFLMCVAEPLDFARRAASVNAYTLHVRSSCSVFLFFGAALEEPDFVVPEVSVM